MAEQINFRSLYYGKVGFKSVEVKRSLEILLKENPLDVEKIRQFCLRFPVPALYRLLLWKVVLGVVPAYQDNHGEVMKQRQEQYADLHEATMVMKRADTETKLSQVFLNMLLIEDGLLPMDSSKLLEDPEHRYLMSMSQCMLDLTDDPVDAFWLTSRFYHYQLKFRKSMNLLMERTEQYLEREDSDKKLFQHLCQHRAFRLLPLQSWFESCFAGALPETSYERVWDKFLGGSISILVCTAVAILLVLRRPLLTMDNIQDMINYLSKIPPDSGDIIVSKAIEIWQNHGSSLVPPVPKEGSPSIDKDR